MPPPALVHETSLVTLPVASRLSRVPPTDSTAGDTAGYSTTPEVSPEEATKATLAWPAGVVKAESYWASPANSLAPNDIDTTATPGWAAAYWVAARRSVRLLELASTRRRLASGAMAWAHSTSRAVSRAQLALGPGRS